MGAYSLMLGVAAAHTSVPVGDDTHDSTLEDTGLHPTVLEAVSVVLVFKVVISFSVGLTI